MKRGLSLIEVLVAATVMATVLLGLAMFQASVTKTNATERDRAFAVQKAVQIMEEVSANQVTGGTSSTQGIDALDDGSNYSYFLTVDPKVTDPSVSLSGNPKVNGYFKFVRHIGVVTPVRDKRSRQVTITIYQAKAGLTPLPANPNRPLATITNVVRSDLKIIPTTQVYDLYVVNIENIGAAWSDPNTLETAVRNTITAVQGNNPGLSFHMHWIRQLAYGRDPYYAPYVNVSQTLANDPLNWVYFYPGTRNSTTNAMDPNVMDGQANKDGTITNGVAHTDPEAILSSTSYSFADQFNHAMREPEEAQKSGAVVGAGGELTLRMLMEEMAEGDKLKNAIILNLQNEDLPVPPVRNYSDAARVPDTGNINTTTNTFGVTAATTGGLTDGARARLVSHPITIWAKNDDSHPVDIRVYPFLDGNVASEPSDPAFHNGQIIIRGMGGALDALHDSTCTADTDMLSIWALYRLAPAPYNDPGFTWTDSGHTSYTYKSSSATPTPGNNDGYYWAMVWPTSGCSDSHGALTSPEINTHFNFNVTKVVADQPSKDLFANDLVITFQGIQYAHPPTSRSYTWIDSSHNPQTSHYRAGMHTSQLLHGYNYFPDPYLPTLDTDRTDNETDDNDQDYPQNTQCFQIQFKPHNKGMVRIDTSIGDPNVSHGWPNRSSTYCWVGGGTNVPLTEQYQFMGDPRENPYSDLRDNEGYNRNFFNGTSNAYNFSGPIQPSGYPHDANVFPDTTNGWNGTGVDVDVPRLGELWRSALLGANAELVQPGGQLGRFIALGGDFSETLSNKPYTGAAGTSAHDELGAGSKRYLVQHTSNGWYSKPWLGELFPDNEWTNWTTNGNLPVSNYRRTRYSAITNWPSYPSGTNYDRTKYLNAAGAASLTNGGSGTRASSWFADPAASGTANINANGQQLAANFKVTLPSSLPGQNPMNINDSSTSNRPPSSEWNSFADVSGNPPGGWANALEWTLAGSPFGFYDWSGGGGLEADTGFVIRNGNATGGYLVLTGNAPPASQTDANTQMEVSLLSGMQMLFENAKYKDVNNHNVNDAGVKLLPLVTMDSPANLDVLSSSQTVTWHTNWLKWNQSPYTSTITDAGYQAYANRPKLVYFLKYSSDGGATWHYPTITGAGGVNISGNPPATAGLFDSDTSKQIPEGTLTVTWDASSLPAGNYIIRVEAYRLLDATHEAGWGYTHYAYHYAQVQK